jgi:hypothetical protein
MGSPPYSVTSGFLSSLSGSEPCPLLFGDQVEKHTARREEATCGKVPCSMRSGYCS